MPPDYAGIVLMVGLALAGVLVVAGAQRRAAGRARRSPLAPPAATEQGAEGRGRSAVRFHLVALLSVVLAAEIVLLLLWAVSFRQLGLPGLLAIAAFAVPLVVGLFYEWAKGAFEW